MKKISGKIYFLTFLFACFLGVTYSLSHFFSPPNTARAAATDNITGYAWSDTGGWISFNCTNTGTCGTSNYGVSIDATGNFSGYAWSDIAGWISFNAGDVTGCPGGVRANFNSVTNKVSGFARIQSGIAGGTGCIKLGQSGLSPGVSYNTTSAKFEGYAWEDGTLGWVSFNCTNTGTCGTSNYAVTFGTPNLAPTPQINSPLSGTTTSPISLSGTYSDPDNDPMQSFDWYETSGWTTGACSGVPVYSGGVGSDPFPGFSQTLTPGKYSVYFKVCDNRGACTCVSNDIAIAKPQCSDGIDNDGDGWFDNGDTGSGASSTLADPACYVGGVYDPNIVSESPNPKCSDGIDNDGDHKIDSQDPGCHTDFDSSNAASYDKFNNSEDNMCGVPTTDPKKPLDPPKIRCDASETFKSCPSDCPPWYIIW